VTGKILHAAILADWSAAQEQGVYTTGSLASEGFIHCSKPEQILRVVNSFFTGRRDLILLVIDPARLTSELRWEPGVDIHSDLFPHVYGTINLDAVMEALALEPQADGTFILPAFKE
jgi:uncharacterized protein (DUF952 family)